MTFPKLKYLSYILVPLVISLALGGSKPYSGPGLIGCFLAKNERLCWGSDHGFPPRKLVSSFIFVIYIHSKLYGQNFIFALYGVIYSLLWASLWGV